MSKEITIYTDGSARGNPGPGGYEVILMSGIHRKELSQGYKHTAFNTDHTNEFNMKICLYPITFNTEEHNSNQLCP